ncbi:MAG: gamma carbonic anhydrase family protein [Rhizobiaceae bacterium]
MPMYALADIAPKTQGLGTYWVAPGAHVIGDVILGVDVGIWFGTILRGDKEPLVVGDRSNIQELCMIHADPGFPTNIGPDVTIGHRAIVHGCTIGQRTLVGMGATILNGAVIGNDCLIGAGALVTEGKIIPDGSVVMGTPGKVVREVDDKMRTMIARPTLNYVKNWKRFADELKLLDDV